MHIDRFKPHPEKPPMPALDRFAFSAIRHYLFFEELLRAKTRPDVDAMICKHSPDKGIQRALINNFGPAITYSIFHIQGRWALQRIVDNMRQLKHMPKRTKSKPMEEVRQTPPKEEKPEGVQELAAFLRSQEKRKVPKGKRRK